MGYSTNYELSTIPATECDNVRAAFIQACDGYNPFNEACKWYEHETDAKAVSCSMPGTIICIRGNGEDPGDEWVLYAFDGQAVKHKREAWTPPAPPTEWKASPAQLKALAKAAADREYELAELKRLRTKYG